MKIASTYTLAYLWLGVAATELRSENTMKWLKGFTSLVVFGDSYTDMGIRRYRPNPDGTVGIPRNVTSTGGRVWPQYVGQYTGANIYDYAVSGAMCTNDFSPFVLSGIKEDQVPEFLLDNSFVSNVTGEPALINPSDETAYAVWIGTNDIGNRAFFTDLEPAGLSLTAYTDCVYEQLDRLHAIGAKNFVIINLAPLDLLPQYAAPDAGGLNATEFWRDKYAYNPNITQSAEKMRQYSTLLNEVYEFQTPFHVKLSDRYQQSSFAIFDVYSLLTEMYNHPGDYFNGTAPANVQLSVKGCGSACESKLTWDSYMWYDDLHPGEQTDRIIAKEFIEVVKGTSRYARYWSN